MNPNPNPAPPLLVFFSFFFFFPLLALTASCPSSCANIHNISYPFGANLYCGYPGFQFSCNNEAAQWTPHLDPASQMNQEAYAVVSLDNARVNGSISVTWPMRNDCMVFDASDLNSSLLNTSLFAGTSLSVFNTASLTYSEGDIYLLLNCNDTSAATSSSGNELYCSNFSRTCPSLLISNTTIQNTNCVQLETKNRTNMKAELKQALHQYNCTAFVSVATNESSSLNASTVSIEVHWTLPQINNSQCAACEASNGTCGYISGQNGFYFVCYCRNNVSSDTDCRPGCTGVSCSKGKLIAAVVLPIVGLACMLLVFECLVRRRRKVFWWTVPGGSSHHFVTERGKSFAAQFGPVAAREFPFKELADATQFFSDDKLIGDGGFGAVYQGILYDGRKVAVKRMYHDNFRRMEQFYNEIKILSSLRHPYLVELYGYCCEDDTDLLLVFEYVSNGTLASHLQNLNTEALPWKIRLNIALEIAVALSYLHNDVSPPIYHRDVKSTNVLLEKDFRVKLADFGLSRLVPLQATHVSTLPQGTPGYLDPDYHHSYQLTDKSDVYSFGVVLVELISALPAVDTSRSRGEINLSSFAVSKIVCGSWQELVDPGLKIDGEPHVGVMVRNVAELAFRCLNSEKDDRPDMKEVVQELSIIRQSGYGELKSELNVNLSFDKVESSRLINDIFAPSSPYSVHSSMLSSNASSYASSSLFRSSRGSVR